MTRRFLCRAALGSTIPRGLTASSQRLEIPVHLLTDKKAKYKDHQLNEFQSTVWKEAVDIFHNSGMDLKVTRKSCEISRYPSGNPLFEGLSHRVINLVLADHIPLAWDNGRSVAGLSTVYRGYHLALIALPLAHTNRIPFLDINTVIHELLHLFFQDFFTTQEGVLSKQHRDLVNDWHATRMWLFSDGTAVRHAAISYLACLERLCR